MPFLAPIIPAIVGLATAGAGVAGAVEGAQAGGRQQKALTLQEQIAQQEQADKQKIFDQLQPFFSQYLGAGSPFLPQIQRASAETNAKAANNAAGNIRSTMATSGLGYGPSGTTAAALSNLGASTAATTSSDYLTNLLNNEQLKFQAAQGLQGIGSMAGSPQNQPSVSAQLPYQNLGSGLTGLAQILKTLTMPPTSGGSSTPAPTTSPNSAQNFPIPGIPGTSGSPTTQGIPV